MRGDAGSAARSIDIASGNVGAITASRASGTGGAIAANGRCDRYGDLVIARFDDTIIWIGEFRIVARCASSLGLRRGHRKGSIRKIPIDPERYPCRPHKHAGLALSCTL